MLETFSFEEVVQDKGIAFIVNCENFSLKIMKWATPRKLKVMVAFLQVVLWYLSSIYKIRHDSVSGITMSCVQPILIT